MAERSISHDIAQLSVTLLGNIEQVKSVFTGKEIEVGKHLVISPLKYRALEEKHLSDGRVIKPGEVVGRIDFIRHIPRLGADVNLLGFSRELFAGATHDLETLAYLCEAHDSRLEKVVAFAGISHLAGPLAKRLGFDIFPVARAC